MNKDREYFTIKKALEKEGLKLSQEVTIGDIMEYLEMAEDDYTIFDWIKDTKMNYPECFL